MLLLVSFNTLVMINQLHHNNQDQDSILLLFFLYFNAMKHLLLYQMQIINHMNLDLYHMLNQLDFILINYLYFLYNLNVYLMVQMVYQYIYYFLSFIQVFKVFFIFLVILQNYIIFFLLKNIMLALYNIYLTLENQFYLL